MAHSVAGAVSFVADVIRDIVPVEVPGRKFTIGQSLSIDQCPSVNRHVLILPALLMGQGSYTGPYYAPVWTVCVMVLYVGDVSDTGTLATMMQDAIQILGSITKPPNVSTYPWNSIKFTKHTSQGPTDDRPFWSFELEFEVEQQI